MRWVRAGNSRRRPCLPTRAAANLQELARATIVSARIDGVWATTTTTTTSCMLLHCAQQYCNQDSDGETSEKYGRPEICKASNHSRLDPYTPESSYPQGLHDSHHNINSATRRAQYLLHKEFCPEETSYLPFRAVSFSRCAQVFSQVLLQMPFLCDCQHIKSFSCASNPDIQSSKTHISVFEHL